MSGGISWLKDGRFVTLTSADGLGSNTISSIEEGTDGAMWFATSDGLSKYFQGNWKTYTIRDGLPSGEITTILRDASGVLWIGTSDGLAYVSSDSIHSVADTIPALSEAILGIADDGRGCLWVTTSSHVMRVRRLGLLKGKFEDGEYSEYGEEDGLKGTEGLRRHRSVIAGPRGVIWLSTPGGVSKVDLKRLGIDSPLITPHIESILRDGKEVSLNGPIEVAAAPQRITINYAAVSLAMPERVRYRYKFEGFDHAWSPPVDTRQVVYTNLGPGSYRFALMASNSSGIWSRSESDLLLTIKPTFWQSWWFRLTVAAFAVVTLWLFYLYRLKLITTRIQERLDAQLEERTRIARELHDTLLQGFQGLMLRLQAVLKSVPSQGPAHKMIEEVLDRADEVLLEGRESVKDLRQSRATGDELSEVLRQYGEDLRQGAPILFGITIVGNQRTLGQIVFNETVRIAREALLNSFQHAQAKKIEIEITYSRAAFCLRVRDDGIGIDASFMHQGREGHWGLSGMRERAQKIGGKFSIWTNPGAGTEMELTVPAKLAYPAARRLWPWNRLGRRATL